MRDERYEWVERADLGALRVVVPASEAAIVRGVPVAAVGPGESGGALLEALQGQVSEATLQAVAEQVGAATPAGPPLAQAAMGQQIKLALTFGGQAQAWIDELAELWALPEARPVIEACAAALRDELRTARLEGLHPEGFDIIAWITEPGSRPSATALAGGPISQPMIFVTQMARLAALRRFGLASEHIARWCSVATGHSQGVISAIIAAEGHGPKALAARAAVVTRYLIWEGVYTQRCWGAVGGSTPMVAVTGAELAVAEAAVQGVDACVALHNAPGRYVLSGTTAALTEAVRRLKRATEGAAPHGPKPAPAQIEWLAVSAPYHSQVFAPAVAPCRATVARLAVDFDPAHLVVPVLRYEDGAAWTNRPDIPETLCLSAVRWTEVTAALVAHGVSHVVDLGPGAGVAALTGINVGGFGVRVIAAATAAGERILQSPKALTQPVAWSDYAPRAIETAGGRRLVNRWTELTGRPPIILPGMTPTTADVPIVAASANGGFLAELAGGGQTTEAMLRQRADELREALEPGEGYVFNALFLDPYLWGLHLGERRVVQQLRAEGHPIEGVTISAGLPPVEQAVALLKEWRALGMPLNSLKVGDDAGVRHVLEVADADDGSLIIQIEGGRAGGHHGFEDLDGLLLRWYARIRRRPSVVLTVGGGIADDARVQALLSGTWSARYGRPPMPVDAVFVGTPAMAAKEALTSDSVKTALAAAPGDPTLLARGAVAGGVRSGRSGLGADIHYLDNHAAQVAALLDGVAGKPKAVAAKRAAIVEALATTAKPWFGSLETSYHAWLTQLVALMALGQGGAYEDGVWLDSGHRGRFGDCLRRGLQRCNWAGALPADAALDAPSEVLADALSRCPLLAERALLPEDARWFVDVLCARPGKPVPFVPVIDANVHRWFTRDALWQSHDARFDAESVLVLPGPAAVAGITRVDEPVAELLHRFLAATRAAAPVMVAPAAESLRSLALNARVCLEGRTAGANRLPAAVAAGASLTVSGDAAELVLDHALPTGARAPLTLNFAVQAGHRAPLRVAGDHAAVLRAWYAQVMPEVVELTADRIATYRLTTGDAGAQSPIQLLFAVSLPATIRATLADALGADPLSLLHTDSVVERLAPLAAGPVSVTVHPPIVADVASGRRMRVLCEVHQHGVLVGRLDQTFLVRHATGAPVTGPERPVIALPHGVPVERIRRIVTATIEAPRDMAAFAHASGDLNPIHRDAALAALAGLPAPIVHGQWTAAAVGARLGALRSVHARFMGPVALGASLEITADVIARHEGDEIIEAEVHSDGALVLSLTAVRPTPVTAVMFPGQGSQGRGMGMDGYGRSEAARAIWDRADAHTRAHHGFSLLEVVRNNPKRAHVLGEVIQHPGGLLNVTQFTQVALTVLSVAGVAELRETGAVSPTAAFCGHSVGEYSAISAMTDLLPLEALIDVVYQRGLTMQHFVERDAEGRSAYGMGVIRPHLAGLDDAAANALVERVAVESGAPMYVVNHNVRGRQYAVAGHVDALAALREALPAKAWVAIDGIDVPFHSPLLVAGVPAFRAVLQRCIPHDTQIENLVGRYIPNLVAQPFALTPAFVDAVVAVTGVALPELREDPVAHGRALLIELLAWQFASPVRWIETQDLLLARAERVIEVGPATAPVLGRMLKSSMRGGPHQVVVLHAELDRDAVRGNGEVIVEQAPETPAPRPMFVAPSVAADPLPAAAGVVISDQPFGVNEALRALVAIALGQPLVAADGERSLDELLGGNSARRNQVLVDLGKEFGVGAVDGAHDLPMSKLVAAIEKAASGRYTHPGVYLRAAQDAGLKDIGRSRKAASAWFEGYDLPAGRRAAVLTVLAAEGGSLEAALASYGKRVGTTFSKRVAAAAGPSASAAGEASGVAQARWHGVARAAFEAAGLDPVWVDRAALAGAQRSSPVVKATDGARFDARRHVAFTAACAWARADALRLSLALARGEAPDLSGLVRAASPALLVALDALANRADAQSAHTLRACRDEASAALESTLPWANDTALITGAGPDSIAEGVVAQLLEGGARVVVTTSRPKRARVARYKALYRAHAGRGAELHIVPLDQGNLADIDTLCAWLYSAQSEVRGANTIETKAPWRPTLCFPFGAVPAEGDPSTYDAAIVASLQVNLVGVERIVGALAREAIAHHAPAVHMVLPLSPNHGQMGRDGLYAEAKAGLEAMLPRWRSEHSHWGRGTTICGARIGWVRGTGLMKGLDGVHEAVEQALGFSTFSPSEMARALLERCTPEARLDAQQGPLVADLTGGFGGGDDLRTLISEALSQVQAAQTEIAAPSTALPYPDFAFPALPAASGEPALPLEGQVAVVGFGEVGVFGNARVRWAMERDGALHDEAALELAWLCGCVRFEKGAWVDIESGDAVAASEVFERYGLAERVGVRTLTAFDPAELVLMDEIVLEQDLRFSVPDRGHAESFRALDPERTEVLADGEGWLVIRRAGTRIRVPRVLPLDRNVAGQLPDGWDPARMGFDAAQLDSIDPVAIYNLLATADAFRSAGLALDDLDSVAHPTRVGCSQGSGIGGMRALTRLYTESRLDERRQTDVLQETLINVSAAWPAMLQYGGFGPMVNPVAACATAAISVEIGADLIRAGKADFIVAGAFDDLSAEGARGFADMKATIDAETLRTRGLEPDEASRPCDARRGGFVEAQGGGTFLLCDAQRAVHAGLPIYGIVAGAWSRTDGLQRSVPAPGPGLLSIGAGGMRGPLGTALAALGLGADDVGFVSMHGTSTDANDTNETRLHADLAQALGRTPGLPLPIVAQKALTGHAKGGAAAWQLIGALQAMADGVVPAMRNLEEPDTRLRDLTPLIYSDEALHFAPGQLKAALITSLGFGHVGAAVCVAHPDTLLSRLSADQLEAYGARRAQRAATCLRAEHAVRLGDVQPFEARTPGDPEAARARLLEDGAW